MLNENEVIDAVVSYLRDKGWHIEHVSKTDQRGFDILARKGNTTLAVGAKGGTSSNPGSRCFGKPFDSGQKSSHVSRALYESAKVVSGGVHRAGIAVPSDNGHRKLIDQIRPALKKLNVIVFLVESHKNVQEITPV